MTVLGVNVSVPSAATPGYPVSQYTIRPGSGSLKLEKSILGVKMEVPGNGCHGPGAVLHRRYK